MRTVRKNTGSSNATHMLRGFRSGEDSLAGRRSHAFTLYLEKLPADERQKILAAERAYVEGVQSATSPEGATLKAYNESMLGIKEGEPVEHRGFVV